MLSEKLLHGNSVLGVFFFLPFLFSLRWSSSRRSAKANCNGQTVGTWMALLSRRASIPLNSSINFWLQTSAAPPPPPLSGNLMQLEINYIKGNIVPQVVSSIYISRLAAICPKSASPQTITLISIISAKQSHAGGPD